MAKLQDASKLLNEVVCFHCQQAAEKYLKALLEEGGLSIPKTHDLLRPFVLVQPMHPTLRPMRRAAPILSRYVVDVRYPGGTTSKRQVLSAIRWADRIRSECRRILKIRDRKARKSP